ncbi:MAG: hypothetical protein RIR79_2050 [Pseudomonadota bacterium]
MSMSMSTSMSILGTVVRTRPEHLDAVVAQLVTLAGLEIALNPLDGRLVILIENTPTTTAVQTMEAMAQIPEILSTSLVYEYSDASATP